MHCANPAPRRAPSGTFNSILWTLAYVFQPRKTAKALFVKSLNTMSIFNLSQAVFRTHLGFLISSPSPILYFFYLTSHFWTFLLQSTETLKALSITTITLFIPSYFIWTWMLNPALYFAFVALQDSCIAYDPEPYVSTHCLGSLGS